MASQQTLDQHFQQKKLRNQSTKSFYGKKDISPLKNLWVANVKEKEIYKPAVKKLISFSSDESDSDSDTENILCRRRTIKDDDENLDVSPKKVAKFSQQTRASSCSKAVAPKTPKSSLKIPKSKTPSTHLAELKLSPKKAGPRKQLFEDKYQDARKALHSSVPENLVCRENELSDLHEYITNHIKNKTSGSLYISGSPGTGKTAALMKTIDQLPTNLTQIYLNCTSMKTPSSIFAKVCEGLKLTPDKKNFKSAIEKFFTNSRNRRKYILLILDEIDSLESKSQSVLYSIFEWPSIASSKLILIGIANTLDLTDRILPRLQARCEVKPKVMHFTPYTNDQIVAIITDRLQQANVTELFTNNALILLAKKISALSGDIRKTLDICRRLFEFTETKRNTVVLQQTNGIKTDSATELVKVDIKEVLAILNQVYGGSKNIDEAEDKFPLQQKLVLCSLMLLLNKGKNKDVNIGRLYAVYKKVCQKRDLPFVDNSEFVNLCSLIETRGIIRIVSKKDSKLSKIHLEWDLDQLNVALNDKNLTSDIINDASCL